jgi:hypothetical protein
MRHTSSGDLVNRHSLVRGNKKALELWVALQFYQQALSLAPIPPSLPSKIAQGFIQYWLGATLRPGLPPAVVPPGMITSMTVLNPGTVTPLPLPPAKTPEEFVESLIRLGKMHLFTVGGTMIVNVITPTGPVPTPAPWFGYKVIDARANFNIGNTLKKLSGPTLPGIPNLPPPPPPSPTPTPPPSPTPTPPPSVPAEVIVIPYVTSLTKNCVNVAWQTNVNTTTAIFSIYPVNGGLFGGSSGTSFPGDTLNGLADCSLQPGVSYYINIQIWNYSTFLGEYNLVVTTPLL